MMSTNSTISNDLIGGFNLIPNSFFSKNTIVNMIRLDHDPTTTRKILIRLFGCNSLDKTGWSLKMCETKSGDIVKEDSTTMNLITRMAAINPMNKTRMRRNHLINRCTITRIYLSSRSKWTRSPTTTPTHTLSFGKDTSRANNCLPLQLKILIGQTVILS